jgi:site-specific recombinase XerD
LILYLQSKKEKRTDIQNPAIGKDLTPYFLRHEYATELMKAGYSLPEAMYLMGHSTRKMLLEVYTHVECENNCG